MFINIWYKYVKIFDKKRGKNFELLRKCYLRNIFKKNRSFSNKYLYFSRRGRNFISNWLYRGLVKPFALWQHALKWFFLMLIT